MKIKWKRNIFKQYWWPKQEKGDEGKCGPFCCAIVAQIVKPKLKRKWLSKELESTHDWLSASEIVAFLSKFRIHSITGGPDPTDLTALDREFNYVSKTNPLIVSCVGPIEGQNHWVVVAEKRGEKVRVIDPKCGPIWADPIDGYKPKYMRGETVDFAGTFVKVV